MNEHADTPQQESPATGAKVVVEAARPEPAPPPARQKESSFQLDRVFSLLALVGVIVALGGIMQLDNSLGNRLDKVELNLPLVSSNLNDRIKALDETVTRGIAASNAQGRLNTRMLMIGAELTRARYLLDALATDESVPEGIRERAARVHAEATALLEGMEKGENPAADGPQGH